VETYDPTADREALQRLAEDGHRFSPLIGLEDAPAPESLLLDITGLPHLFGGERVLAEQVIQHFTRSGFLVRLGMANTIGAAWAVAHFARRGRAEVGGGKADGGRGKGSGFGAEGSEFRVQGSGSLRQDFWVFDNSPPSALRLPPSALSGLPIEALRLSDETVDLLHQLGIHQISQIERLPRADLAARFGDCLLKRLDQATGRLAETMPAHRPPPELMAERTLEHPTTRGEAIEFILEQLIEQVAVMLVGCGRGAVRLECRLHCQSGADIDCSVGLFQPTVSSRHLWGLVQMRLERIRLPSPVEAVHVRASVTASPPRQQQSFFGENSAQERCRHMAGLIDRLASRLGRRAVVRARLVADAQPELAYQYDPLVENSSGKRLRSRPSHRMQETDLPPRPLRLCRRPVPLTVVSIVPDGPPVRFYLQSREYCIAETWGPERIETGWWRGRSVGRDYYRIETRTGRRFWLFRRLRDEKWFLHGIFE
jgi:protein ImuB